MNFTFDLPSRTKYVHTEREIRDGCDSARRLLTCSGRNLRHNVLNNYTAALLMSLIKAGLVEVLIELGNDVFGEEMTKVRTAYDTVTQIRGTQPAPRPGQSSIEHAHVTTSHPLPTGHQQQGDGPLG